MAMKFHNPHGLLIVSGVTYWAGYMKTGSYGVKPELVVVPIRFEGDEPFLAAVTPSGIYSNEWWVLSVANPPVAKAVTDAAGVMTGVQLDAKFTEYPEAHFSGAISLENMDIHKEADLSKAVLGLQVAPDGRVWVCVNGISLLRMSPHPDGQMNRS